MSRLEIVSKFFLALAATIFFFICGVIVPPAGVILIPTVPQPMLRFGLKYGGRWHPALALSAAAVIWFFAGKELALVYVFFALLGIVLFLSLGRGRSIESVVVGSAGGISAALGSLLFLAYGSWSGIAQGVRASLTHHLNVSFQIYQRIGFSEESVGLLKERAPEVVEMIVRIMPALSFIGIALIVLANLYLLCRRFPERRAEWISTENLREWKGPESLVWYLIGSGFVLLVPGVEGLAVLALNVLLVTMAFYFFQGLAIVAYYFHKKNVPLFLRGLTYLLIVFEQIFTLLVVGLGLFDLWGDFRRLNKKDLNPSGAS